MSSPTPTKKLGFQLLLPKMEPDSQVSPQLEDATDNEDAKCMCISELGVELVEAELQSSPQLENATENEDDKYISGLGTKMVTTIQEVKEGISHMEDIFCGKLFPSFQASSKSSQTRFAEVLKAAQDVWKKKENGLLFQIEELKLEKDKALEDNRRLIASLEGKAKSLIDLTRTAAVADWRRKESALLLKIEELHFAKQQILEENRGLVVSLEKEKTKLMYNEKLLHMYAMEKKLLVDKLENLQKNDEVAELQCQLRKKAEEVTKAKQRTGNLLRLIEVKDEEMITEKKKQRNLVDAYKRLNFLCNRFGLDTENSLPGNRMEEESKLSSLQKKQRISYSDGGHT